MLIDPLFDELARVLSPSDSSFEQAVGRAERIGKILERDQEMQVAFTVVGGSCGKQTATEPLDDADLFVYLQPGGWRGTRKQDLVPATVLRAFEDRIEFAYRSHVENGNVRVRRQMHSLRLELFGARSISVDMVPLKWDGNDDLLVMLPDRATREWRLTCVHRQQQLLDGLDCPGRPLRRAIRLLKQWRTEHDLPLRSYALEVLVLHAAYNGTAKHPRALFWAVLEGIGATELREPIAIDHYGTPTRIKRAAVHILDPATPDNNVGDNIDAAGRARIVTRARRTLADLSRLEDYLERDGHVRAERAFAKTFGYQVALGS